MHFRRLLVASVLALLVGACSDDDDPAANATTTAAAADGATTTAGDGGDGGGATTTIGADTTASSVDDPTEATAIAPPDTEPASDALEDGENFGYITELTVAGDTATGQFDLAQLLTGEEAIAAAEEDGAEAPNDYYIRNLNPRLRPIELGPDVSFNVILDGDGCCDPVGTTLEEFAANVGPDVPVLLTVVDGVITGADEVFFP